MTQTNNATFNTIWNDIKNSNYLTTRYICVDHPNLTPSQIEELEDYKDEFGSFLRRQQHAIDRPKQIKRDEQRAKASEQIQCRHCNSFITRSHKSRHEKSKKCGLYV